MGKTVKARVEADLLRAAVKPRLGRLMEEYGKFVRLAANRRDAAERAHFAKKAEAALKELDVVKREAGRMTK
jgi:hypothetical protein